MRLFVALDPPSTAVAELDAAVDPLRAEWPVLRWVGSDRWHVTLAFLGEVAEGKLDDLSARLGRAAARHDAQALKIGEGGAFPSAGKARVLIAHILPARADHAGHAAPAAQVGVPARQRMGGRSELAGLTALARSVSAAGRRAGAPEPDEGRRYRPHLTLARCRQPTDAGDLVRALGAFSGQPWTATQIHLIRSQLGPAPHYETLGSWPLKAG